MARAPEHVVSDLLFLAEQLEEIPSSLRNVMREAADFLTRDNRERGIRDAYAAVSENGKDAPMTNVKWRVYLAALDAIAALLTRPKDGK